MPDPGTDISPRLTPEQPLPLESFLDALRRAGFTVDADHYHEVYQVLTTLAPEHRYEELKTLLAPLFVRNAKEQQRFYDFMDDFFLREVQFRPATGGTRLRVREELPISPEVKGPEKQKRSFAWMPGVLGLLAVVVVLVLLIVYFPVWSSWLAGSPIWFYLAATILFAIYQETIGRLLRSRLSYSVAGMIFIIPLSVALVLYDFFDDRQFLLSWQAPWLWGVFTAVVLLPFNAWLARREQKKETEKPSVTVSRTGPLTFPPDVPFPRVDLIERSETYQLSNRLNRALSDTYDTREIDVPLTLERTLRQAGIIEVAFQRIVTRPQYLLLIDANNANEHEIEWFDYLLQVLQGDDARLERYFFDYDPSYCRLEREGDSVPLANLYGGQRLILLTDGDPLVDPVTGGLFKWSLDLFALWSEKAILSPRPVEEWGYTERQLASEFFVAPSTVDGLMESVAHFDNLSDKTIREWRRENTYDVLNTDDPELIRRALPEEVFAWLCACAVYPELHWKLTLHLGGVLEERPGALLNREHLTSLSRLKWFREGRIPDELRRWLILQLPVATLTRVREALHRVLTRSGSVPPYGSYAFRTYLHGLQRNGFELASDANEEEARRIFPQLQIAVAELGTTDRELLAFVNDEERIARYGLDLESFKDVPSPTPTLGRFTTSRQDRPGRLYWVFFRGEEILRLTEHLDERVEGMRTILLIIPGLNDTLPMLEVAGPVYLRQGFDRVLTYEYNGVANPIEESAKMLQVRLEEAGLTAEQGVKLTILANGVGGLVARDFIEEIGGNALVEHLLLVGVPNAGSRLLSRYSSFYSTLENVLSVVMVMSLFRRVANWFFRGVSQLYPGEENEFLTRLNASPDPGVPYSIVAGNAAEYYRDKPQTWTQRQTLRLVNSLLNNQPNDLVTDLASLTAIDPNRRPAPVVYQVPATVATYFTEEGSVRVIRELLEKGPEEEMEEVVEPAVETVGEQEQAEVDDTRLIGLKEELHQLLERQAIPEVLQILRDNLAPESDKFEVLIDLENWWQEQERRQLQQSTVSPEGQAEDLERVRKQLSDLVDNLLPRDLLPPDADFKEEMKAEGLEVEEPEAPETPTGSGRLNPLRKELGDLLSDLDAGPRAVINRLFEVLRPDSPFGGRLAEWQDRLVEAEKKTMRKGARDAERAYREVRERIALELVQLIDEELTEADLAETPDTRTIPTEGRLLIRVPRARTGDPVEILVRIGQTEEQVLQGIKREADVTLYDVRMTDIMAVELADPSALGVFNPELTGWSWESLSEREQLIEKSDFSEWRFLATPQRRGAIPIQVKVIRNVIEAGRERFREQVFELKLEVEGEPRRPREEPPQQQQQQQQQQQSSPPPPTYGSFTDPRDGQTYRTIELNGQTWLADNLNYDVGEGCWFYNNDPKNGERYGRLYTWDAAQRTCPKGWRLPTEEEWEALAESFGGYDKAKVYEALIEGGRSGFEALLGGRRLSDGGFDNLGDEGYYWSASKADVWSCFSFDGYSGELYYLPIVKTLGFSCRCLQD